MTAVVLAAIAFPALAAEAVAGGEGPALLGIPVDFILFGLTLLGVALFHRHTLYVALAGLAVITAYKLGFTGFKTGAGLAGLGQHMLHEWVILTNLLGLLLGFALLSNHFEKSHIPAVLPRFLPDDWKGAFVLLVMIWRAVELPRQHCGGDDRRHHRRNRVPAQGPHRISRGDRCSLQCGGCRQRRGRHHHHHDVDRRCEPGGRAGGICRVGRRARHIRGARRAPATALLAHHQGGLPPHTRGLEPGRDRGR